MKTIISATVSVLILAAGVGAFLLLQSLAPQSKAKPLENPGRLVRAFPAQPVNHRIAVTAYGSAQAALEWKALAEVASRITTINEKFEPGEILPAGTEIVRFESQDFELAYEQLVADLKVQQVTLQELQQKQTNYSAIIDLRKEQVELAEKDRARGKELLERNSAAAAEYEQLVSAVAERRSALVDLQNSLALIPLQMELQRAKIAAAEAAVAQAQRDIDRCTIALPMPAICLTRTAEEMQRVAIGESLGTFLGLEKGEVQAELEPRRMLMLFPKISQLFGPLDLTKGQFAQEITRRLDLFKVPADITWRAGEGLAQWRGSVSRIGATLDPQTRTIPVVIAVSDAFSNVRPGVRPALVPGMFCEVRLYGEVMNNVYVIPRDAVRDDHVYVARNGLLEITEVAVAAVEENIAVIESGLSEGDMVILTDIFPAAPGMKLRVEAVDNPASPRTDLPPIQDTSVTVAR